MKKQQFEKKTAYEIVWFVEYNDGAIGQSKSKSVASALWERASLGLRPRTL